MSDPNAPKFISNIWPVAKDEELRSGIKPLVTITQAAHESGWGMSELTEKANNLYGFTGEAWEKSGKPIIKLPTIEFVKGERVKILRPFRAYQSWADSVRDWSNLLHMPRYKLALPAAISGDFAEFAKQVASAGYATDPDYAARLVDVSKEILQMFPDIDETA